MPEKQKIYPAVVRLLAFIVATLITFLLVTGASSLAIYRLVTDGALTLAWLGAAGGIGSLCFRREESEQKLLRGVSMVAVGLGIISLITLGLGLVGWLNRSIAFAIIAVGVGCLAWRFRRGIPKIGEASQWNWLTLAGAPFLGIALSAALVPPGVLWGSDEPNGYDVVEYHLQIPREWYEAGKITRLDHNAFSYFPQGVEMHYLLAMHLRGGPWEGMYLAQFMHVAFIALSSVAVYAAARSMTGPAGATIAFLAAATTPWMTLLAPIAYNEGGLLLFGTLAIAWALHARRNNFEYRFVGLAAVMAGVACGAKLTAGPALVVGIPLAWLAAGGFSIRKLTGASAMFVMIALIAFTPWMARTAAWSGNPVFPEAQKTLGHGRFTPEQSERWARAHAPTEIQRSLIGRLTALRDQIAFDWRFGYLLLPVAIAAAGITWRRPETRVLVTLILVSLIFWITATHLQGRFFVLAIPMAALLIAQVQERRMVIAMAAVIAIHAIISLGLIVTKFSETATAFRNAGAFGVTNLDFMIPPPATEAMKSVAPIDLVGDARAFLYQIPMSRLHYRTVFDVRGGAEQSIIDAWRGSPREGAIVIIDPNELRRFRRTYYAVPALSPEIEASNEIIAITPPAR